MDIRPTTADDIPGLKAVAEQTGLFPADMVPELLADFLSEEGNNEIWLTGVEEGTPVAMCYAAPEEMTDGTWNMLAIAVLPELQRQEVGTDMVGAIETLLKQGGQRILVVDTSGKEQFAPARSFYVKNGYTEEARIRDFWSDGDDKVIFRKDL